LADRGTALEPGAECVSRWNHMQADSSERRNT
jgi:hypothetical protein